MGFLRQHPTSHVKVVIPPTIIAQSVGRTSQPPLGACYLAAALEQHGHSVSILDAICEGFNHVSLFQEDRYRYGLDEKAIIDRINLSEIDVLGVSCLSSLQFPFAAKIAELMDETDPRPLLAIGGAHASAAPEYILDNTKFDMVVVGEAEESFPLALKCIEKGEIDKLKLIPGLCFRTKDGIHRTEGAGKIDDIDTIPLPARHLVPMEKYAEYRAPHDALVKNWPVTQLITSRGCPAKCSFCSIHVTMGNAYRPRSIDSVIEELWMLREKWGIREVQFEDDNLTLNRNRARELFHRMIDEHIDLTWSTPNGIALWTMEPDMLDLMARAGCHKLNLAIESGVQRVLDEVINKPLDLNKVPPLIERTKRLGISTTAFFVVGFPRETKAEIIETIRYASKCGADSKLIFIATPYPGTELYTEAMEKGLISNDFSFDGLDINRQVIRHPEIASEELEKMIASADLKFRVRSYFKPGNFKRAFSRVVRDPKRVIGYFTDFIQKQKKSASR